MDDLAGERPFPYEKKAMPRREICLGKRPVDASSGGAGSAVPVDYSPSVGRPGAVLSSFLGAELSADGFQILIQYQSRQEAVEVFGALHGRDIYDGCCQLDIQYSNLSKLQVHFNNDRPRDFTNPSLPTEQRPRSSQNCQRLGRYGVHFLLYRRKPYSP